MHLSSVHTELLYVYAEDLSDELRRSLEILWEHVRTSLKRFDYYFGHFTEQQVDHIMISEEIDLTKSAICSSDFR